MPKQSDPDDKSGIAMVVALGVMSSFGPLSIDLYLPALPQVARDLGVTADGVALTLTSCTLGLGVGQLIVGPLSDRWGRRRPLLAGIVLFTVFSLVCAVAQTLPLLVAARFVQALGGSAGIVLARAVARDLRSGAELVRLFSLMLAVNGLAPVLAPVLGGQLLRVVSWRYSFVALAVLGALILALVWRAVPESLPPTRRRVGGLADALRTYRSLLSDLRFVGQVLTGAFAFATLFAYISAAPFVLQDHYGFSAQLFSVVFGANAVGLIVGTRCAAYVGLARGLVLLTVGAVAVLLSGLTDAGLVLLLPGFFLVGTAFGMCIPTVSANAMQAHPLSAGAASALLGATQFVVGGGVGPLAGRGASDGPVFLGAVMTGLAVTAMALGWASRDGQQLAHRQ
ncbi:MAG: multidrug effflux MFS transporter [Terracoccus sp.]